ncbi:MAG: hypothetical protein ACJAUZ_000168 [Flavobacteriaceae bacterium]
MLVLFEPSKEIMTNCGGRSAARVSCAVSDTRIGNI